MPMVQAWVQLGCPDVESMLAEIAAHDMQAAASARAVWEQIGVHEQAQWREMLAAAVLSYRSEWPESQIGEIAIRRLARMGRR
jgi:hypothetical protein